MRLSEVLLYMTAGKDFRHFKLEYSGGILIDYEFIISKAAIFVLVIAFLVPFFT